MVIKNVLIEIYTIQNFNVFLKYTKNSNIVKYYYKLKCNLFLL